MRISDWSSDVCSSDLAGEIEAGLAAGHEVEHCCREDCAGDLGDPVGNYTRGSKASLRPATEGDGRVEMPAGDVTQRIDHGAAGQAEVEGPRSDERRGGIGYGRTCKFWWWADR